MPSILLGLALALVADVQQGAPQTLASLSQASLKRRALRRALPWTVPVVLIYVTQIVTSVLMGGEWNTSLVVLQAIVVAVFVAIFYALALAKEKEMMEPT